MPYHDWADDYDFAGLDEAAKHLAKIYKRITKLDIMWKEKYGTIRYEHSYLWCTTDNEVEIFDRCLKRTIRLFPEFGGELAEDAEYFFSDPSKSAFYEGITYLSDVMSGKGANDEC